MINAERLRFDRVFTIKNHCKVYMIMPAYNEQERIKKTLDSYGKVLFKKYKNDIKIIIVSESSDKTNEIISKCAAKHKQVKLLAGSPVAKKGKGWALIKGFKYACKSASKNDIIGFADADLSISGADIIKLITTLEREKVDGVIASRYVNGSRMEGEQKPSRFIASRAYNTLIKILFGFKFNDTQCGAKFFRAGALCGLISKLSLMDMSFDIDLLYWMKMQGSSVLEVPVTYRFIYEYTKLNVGKHAPQMFAVAIGFRLKTIFGLNDA